VSNNWEDSTVITAEGTNVEVVEDFCYLGSYLSRTRNCDKECMIKIGKAASVFGRLEKQEYQPRRENQAL